jgi:hypothetical protein
MPRLITCAVLTTLVLLGAAPVAAAKVVKAMKVCGPDRCVRVERAAAQRYHENGGLEGPSIERAVGRVPFYRITTFIGDGQGNTAGHFSTAYSRRLHATIPLDADTFPQPAAWMRLSPEAARRLARLTRNIEPFPARRLEAAKSASSGDSLPPETYRSAATAEPDDDDGLPTPLLAGAPLVLLAGLGVAGWRRRR